MRNKFKKILLLLGDITVLYLSLYLALAIRNQAFPNANTWNSLFWLFSSVFILWIIIFYIANLYNLHLAVNNAKFFNLTLKSIITAGALTTVIFYINPENSASPKTILAIFMIVLFVIFTLWRRLFNWLLNSYLPKRNIAIIGYNKQIEEIIHTVKSKPQLGFKISIIFNDTTEKIARHDNIKLTSNISDLNSIIKEKEIDTILLSTDPHNSKELRTLLFECLPLKVDIINTIKFYENLTGKIPIEAISQMWFLENLTEGSKLWFIKIKRVYDIILAIIILLLSAPFWPLIGIIIKIESQGKVFFTQIRTGQNNQNFTLIKFRTMRSENNNLALTEKNDPRVTKFGNFLRKTRIDEIPQILNVLIGDMSFVGPRPERPEFIKNLKNEIPFYEERMLAKPGLTGWDQVSGEYHSPTQEDSLKKLQYDLFYIKNRSIYLDLSIILKTIATVLSKSGV